MKRKLSFLLIILFCAFAVKAQTELVSTGSGSAYEISYPAAFSYSSGITITFKAHAGSTAGPVTLNINGLGPKTIKKNVTADLALGDIMLNQYATVIYDGTNFQLTSSVPSSSTGVFATVANITSNSPGNFTLDDFVFGSPQLNNDADVNHYSRMYFDKSKSAFRAGYESGAGWNDVSVGNYSVAMGGFVRAMGAYSAAFGNSYADGDYSAALVRGQTSLGASESFSVGYGSYSRSPRAFSLGYFADVSGVNAIGLGSYVKTNASNAIAIGAGVGLGNELLNTTANSIILGSNSNLPSLFIGPSAGTGTTGNIGVGTASPTSRFHVFGLNTNGPQVELSNSASGTAFTTLSPTQLDAAGLFFHTAAITAVGAKSSIIGGGKTSGNYPSILAFYTTATGGAQASERLTIIGNGNVGIGTTTPTAKLDVAGTLKVVDGTQGVGKILTSDASGSASWQDPPSKTSAFRAGAGSQTIVGFGYTIVDWNSVALNDGADFSTATDRYTAPVAGLYYFETGIYFPTYTGRCHTEFYVNGTTNHSSTFGNANGQYTNKTSLLIKLNAGDYVQVRVYNINATSTIGNTVIDTWFSGYRIN